MAVILVTASDYFSKIDFPSSHFTNGNGEQLSLLSPLSIAERAYATAMADHFRVKFKQMDTELKAEALKGIIPLRREIIAAYKDCTANDFNLGGMTPEQAIQKLAESVSATLSALGTSTQQTRLG